MTARLQQLTTSAERKDSELNELRRTIDRLRQAGADVGLIDNKLRRQVSTDSVDSCQSGDETSTAKKKGEGSHKRKMKKEFFTPPKLKSSLDIFFDDEIFI